MRENIGHATVRFKRAGDDLTASSLIYVSTMESAGMELSLFNDYDTTPKWYTLSFLAHFSSRLVSHQEIIIVDPLRFFFFFGQSM